MIPLNRIVVTSENILHNCISLIKIKNELEKYYIEIHKKQNRNVFNV